MSYLFGGDGDDLIYVGNGDTAYGDNGNDTFDVRFAQPGFAYTYGGSGTDRVLANLAAGDSFYQNFIGFQNFNLGASVFSAFFIEEIQIANASNFAGTGDYVYTRGTGSRLIGLNKQVSAGEGASSGPILIDAAVLVETSDVNGYGFTIVNGDAMLWHNVLQVKQNDVWDVYFDEAAFSTRFGAVQINGAPGSEGPTISYTAGSLDLGAEINAGTRLNLGGSVLDTTLHLATTFESPAHLSMPATITTKIELF